MSHDFWMGLLAVPVLVIAFCLAASAVCALIYWSESWAIGEWKLWPKKPNKSNHINLATTVACAKSARYFWLPGWHVVVCRTTLANKDTPEHAELHVKVRNAIGTATNWGGE